MKLKKKIKIPLRKQKKYKSIIKNNDCETIYKSKKDDIIICNPGALHKTSKGNKFRVTIKCRFIKKNEVSKKDEKIFLNYYYDDKVFYKINSNNTKITTPFNKYARSRFGVDFNTTIK